MNECGEDIPRFVSHYLDELSFDSIDVSSLLGRMEQLSAELCSMKHALELNVNVSEDLLAITMDINGRVCALEHRQSRHKVVVRWCQQQRSELHGSRVRHSGPHRRRLWRWALVKELWWRGPYL